MKSGNPETKYLKDYKATPYNILHCDLNFLIHDDHTIVDATTTFEPRGSEANLPLILDGINLDLLEISINRQKLEESDYEIKEDGLILHRPPENKWDLRIKTRIYPEKNLSLEGLYQSNGMYCTQCEAEGFRKITFFYDRPDIMSTYKVRIEANQKYNTLLSNGNLVDKGALPDARHFTVWEDPFPKPSYLFALVVGDLSSLTDTYKAADGRTIDLAIYTEHDAVQQCQHAMESLKQSMKWDEEHYGLICDLDQYNIVAVRHFNMGAMENKGLNIFNSSLLLADQISTTDERYVDIAAVIAHEYFHNWTGNRVTCRDWFQLCLKEGLTVFRDQMFTQSMSSKDVTRIHQVSLLKNVQYPEDASPMAHPPRPDSFIEISNFYTATVYYKGAEVVRMLYHLIGPEAYRRGMDLYFERFDGQAVTQEDFVQCMQDASGKNLEQFFLWYTQAGTPKVNIKKNYNFAQQCLTLNITQHTDPTPGQEAKQALHIPLRIGAIGMKSGKEIPLSTSEPAFQADKGILEIKGLQTQITFHGVEEECALSLERDFSAPISLAYEYQPDEIAQLLKFDPNPCAQWAVAQKFWIGELKKIVSQIAAKQKPQFSQQSQDIASYLMDNPQTDHAFTALLWQLPTYKQLSLEYQSYDVDHLFAARDFLKHSLAEANKNTLWNTFNHLEKTSDDSFSKGAMGRRALINTCLSYLCALDDQSEITAALIRQIENKKHQSEVMGAFYLYQTLKDSNEDAVSNALFARFTAYPTVIDSWFAAQCSADRDDAYEKVQRVMQHPQFDLTNPNRMRAVLFSYCLRNPRHFHRLDGSGYSLCKDNILKLNEINPQMSTGLCRTFLEWKKHTPERQKLMRAALEGIKNQPELSKDVYEIVSKCLNPS